MDGAALRRVRVTRGWTQADLARRLGVTPNTVARWERGERGISEPVARLVRLVAAHAAPPQQGREHGMRAKTARQVGR